jgi:hypothetical protein
MTVIRKGPIPLYLSAFLVAWCLSIAVPAQEHPSNPAPQASSVRAGATSGQYAETDICKTCHQEVWDKHFANTPHAALLKVNSTDASRVMVRPRPTLTAVGTSQRLFALRH